MRCPGLEFRLTPTGARSFSFRFRDPTSGAVTRATIGPYPEISLSDARGAADTLRSKVAKGINPVTEKRRDREDAGSKTFRALSDRYIEEHAKRFKRSADADERNLRLHILPKWSKRRYDHIGRADVIELVEGIVKDGSPVQANRVQALISTIFSFAVDADLVSANPCSRLRKRGAETGKLALFPMQRLSSYGGGRWCHRLQGELASRCASYCSPAAAQEKPPASSRSELHDIKTPANAAWLLPADRSKNSRAASCAIVCAGGPNNQLRTGIDIRRRRICFPVSGRKGRPDHRPRSHGRHATAW